MNTTSYVLACAVSLTAVVASANDSPTALPQPDQRVQYGFAPNANQEGVPLSLGMFLPKDCKRETSDRR